MGLAIQAERATGAGPLHVQLIQHRMRVSCVCFCTMRVHSYLRACGVRVQRTCSATYAAVTACALVPCGRGVKCAIKTFQAEGDARLARLHTLMRLCLMRVCALLSYLSVSEYRSEKPT